MLSYYNQVVSIRGGSMCKWGGHRTTLTCKKKKMGVYIYMCVCVYLQKIKLYAKLTYCDYPNKNIKHPNLKIIQIWVQQK